MSLRFLHTADLHLGKSLYRFSLIEDQRYQLNQILRIAVEEGLDAIILAGDIFDRAIPPLEAVLLWDQFLNKAAEQGLTLFIISGNHDSAIRLSYAAEFMARHHCYLAASFEGRLPSIRFEKNGETAMISLLPYVKNSQLRSFLGRADEEDGSKLMEEFLEGSKHEREDLPSLLVAHQWLVQKGEASEESESEFPQLGQVEILDAEVFSDFGHLACGHLHRAQKVNEWIQYAGSPLAYSASEAGQEKSVSLITLEAGLWSWKRIPLKAKRELRVIEAHFDELWDDSLYPVTEDYLILRILDSSLPPRAMQRLQARFPRLCHMSFELSKKTAQTSDVQLPRMEKTEDLFRAFFSQEIGKELSDRQLTYLREAMEEEER